jgi:hypothetical protein
MCIMINQYVNKLIDNLPDEFKQQKTPLRLDLVLDGGMFNGSYLVGAVHFLKEMERRKYIKVERVSGVSVGSIVALLYLSDSLESMPDLYNIFYNELKSSNTMSCIQQIKQHLTVDKDLYTQLNNKLYISYNNIEKRTKSFKCVYKSNDDVYDAIAKSCHLPFLIDGKLLYKKKYLDGVNPYMFKPCSSRKILHLDLFGYDKMLHFFNVKNEKTNCHRVLSGMLDIHNFYIKQTDTQMCSYVNDWGIINRSRSSIKSIYETVLVYTVCILSILGRYTNGLETSIFYKLFARIVKECFGVMLESYCM